MARVLHGMPLSTLPDPGELQPGDQIVAYREDTGMAYRSSISGLGEASNENIADAFSIAKSYAVGDYCIYNDTLYVFTTAHTGEWDGMDVYATTVCTELTEKVNDSISELEKELSDLQTTVEGRMQAGTANVSYSANTYKDNTIKFDKAFSKAPIVCADLATTTGTNAGYANIGWSIASVSTTQFTLRVYAYGNYTMSNVPFNWIAITQ